MNAALNIAPEGKIIQFPIAVNNNHTPSALKSNGQPKATAADPIRDIADIHKIQQYFLNKGSYRNYMLITLGISFALRGGDLLSIINRQVYNQDGSVKTSFTLYEDKTDKRNTIYINNKSREVLDKYREIQGDKFNLDDPLFMSREKDLNGNHRPITLRQLNRILADAAKAIGIKEHISSHSARKTFAYQNMKRTNFAQDTLFALQYMYNHEDIRTTYIYCGIEAEKIAAMRDATGSLLL